MYSVSPTRSKLKINIPTSKSHFNRALILNQQLNKRVTLKGKMESTDVKELSQALKDLDLGMRQFYFTDGGTTIRFFCAYAASTGKDIEIHVGERFNRRPNLELFKLLTELGVKLEYLEKDNTFPIKMSGGFTNTSLNIDVSKSTQFYTAFKLLDYSSSLCINLQNLKGSQSYIEITDNLVDSFKELQTFQVPPDPSGAAFALAYGAVIERVELVDYKDCLEQIHSDNALYDLFKKLKVEMTFNEKTLSVQPRKFEGFEIDIRNCLDLFPVLCFLASFGTTPSKISSIENLKYKESNRIEEMCKIFKSLGIEYEVLDNAIKIFPFVSFPKPVDLELPNDHRIVMTYYLYLKMLGGGKLSSVESIDKSFGSFLEQFEC